MSTDKINQEAYEEIKKIPSESLRVKALFLQRLNEKRSDLQDETYEKEYLDLKHNFELKYTELNNEISKIVQGSNNEGTEKGIPDFWVNAIKNSSSIFFAVNELDEKILVHLQDVRVVYMDDKVSYKVEFVFSENDFFTNTVLSKTYLHEVKTQELVKIEATEISWRSPDKIPNKIIKTKTIKKGKKIETKTKETPVDTFFDFFKSETADSEDKLDNEEGRFLVDDLIPFSLEYYMKLIDAQKYAHDHDGCGSCGSDK